MWVCAGRRGLWWDHWVVGIGRLSAAKQGGLREQSKKTPRWKAGAICKTKQESYHALLGSRCSPSPAGIWEEFLHTLEVSPLSSVCSANIFSHSGQLIFEYGLRGEQGWFFLFFPFYVYLIGQSDLFKRHFMKRLSFTPLQRILIKELCSSSVFWTFLKLAVLYHHVVLITVFSGLISECMSSFCLLSPCSSRLPCLFFPCYASICILEINDNSH